jgi:hypothetical protein
MSRWNPKPSVDLKNRELRAYLVESYVDFGLFAQEVISKLRTMGVREPCIFEAVSNACVNQPIVYRVQEFYAQPTKPLDSRGEAEVKRIASKLGESK